MICEMHDCLFSPIFASYFITRKWNWCMFASDRLYRWSVMFKQVPWLEPKPPNYNVNALTTEGSAASAWWQDRWSARGRKVSFGSLSEIPDLPETSNSYPLSVRPHSTISIACPERLIYQDINLNCSLYRLLLHVHFQPSPFIKNKIKWNKIKIHT